MPLASNDGPTCSQQGAGSRARADAGEALEQIRKQIAAQIDPRASGRIVVLNNRGYNYASGSPLDAHGHRPRAPASRAITPDFPALTGSEHRP